MKVLETLHKISKKNLEHITLQKKALLINLESAICDLELHQKRVAEEYRNFLNSQYGIFLENYLEAAKHKTLRFNDQIAAIQRKIEKIETEVLEIYSEIKRYEIILAKHKQEQSIIQLKKETKLLDELTILKINAINHN